MSESVLQTLFFLLVRKSDPPTSLPAQPITAEDHYAIKVPLLRFLVLLVSFPQTDYFNLRIFPTAICKIVHPWYSLEVSVIKLEL
jgi:hypothetical protein